MPPAGSAASLRQFGGETYRNKLASSSEAVSALFEETDVLMRKYKNILGEMAEYYEGECVLDACASNIVTRDSPLALHTDPKNTTISCLTGCNPNNDHAPWKGGEFLVADGCYAFDLEPGPDAASHELSPPRNKTGHSSAGCAVLGHDAKNLHGVVPLRPENGKGPEWASCASAMIPLYLIFTSMAMSWMTSGTSGSWSSTPSTSGNERRYAQTARN